MKNSLLTLGAIALLTLGTVQATAILDNNFDSVAPGAYLGFPSGASFGSAPLGNATGTVNDQVTASGGVGGSRYVYDPDNSHLPAVRSAGVADITQTTSFSLYFKNAAPTDSSGGVSAAAGWAAPEATDNVSTFYYGAQARMLLGLGNVAGTNTYNIGYGTNFNAFNEAFAGTGGDVVTTSAMTAGNWYKLSFNLTFNLDVGTPANSTATVTDFAVQDYGVNGLAAGTIVLHLATATFTPGANSLDTNTNNAYAYVSSFASRGADALDNISVATVPEPGTWALLAGSLTLIPLLRRRRTQ